MTLMWQNCKLILLCYSSRVSPSRENGSPRPFPPLPPKYSYMNWYKLLVFRWVQGEQKLSNRLNSLDIRIETSRQSLRCLCNMLRHLKPFWRKSGPKSFYYIGIGNKGIRTIKIKLTERFLCYLHSGNFFDDNDLKVHMLMCWYFSNSTNPRHFMKKLKAGTRPLAFISN